MIVLTKVISSAENLFLYWFTSLLMIIFITGVATAMNTSDVSLVRHTVSPPDNLVHFTSPVSLFFAPTVPHSYLKSTFINVSICETYYTVVLFTVVENKITNNVV